MRVCSVLALVVAPIAACGARTIPLPTTDDLIVPTCSEAVANAPDAASTGCVAAAALVRCLDANGVPQVCISNDATKCSGSSATGDCHDQCSTSDEYAVACEGRPGSPIQPPAGCQPWEGSPSGTVYYCCPCAP